MRNLLFLMPFFLSPDNTGGGGGDPKKDPPKEEPKKDDPPKPDVTAQELADLRKWKADQEAAATKAREDEAKRKGEWEKLATERETEAKTLKEKLAAYEKAEKAREEAAKADLDAALRELPKEVAELIPTGTSQEKLAWLAKAQKAGFIGGDEKPAGTRTQSSGGKVVVPDDIKKYAEERGLDPVTYFLTTQKKNKEGAAK